MSILHKNYKKLYPILKKFETFLVKETFDNKHKSKNIDIRLKYDERISEQEKLIISRIEDITKDEDLNLENLLGFINQKKLHSYLNISNIMRLSKLDFPDLYFTHDLDLLLVRKTLLEKLMLVITSYF